MDRKTAPARAAPSCARFGPFLRTGVHGRSSSSAMSLPFADSTSSTWPRAPRAGSSTRSPTRIWSKTFGPRNGRSRVRGDDRRRARPHRQNRRGHGTEHFGPAKTLSRSEPRPPDAPTHARTRHPGGRSAPMPIGRRASPPISKRPSISSKPPATPRSRSSSDADARPSRWPRPAPACARRSSPVTPCARGRTRGGRHDLRSLLLVPPCRVPAGEPIAGRQKPCAHDSA